MEVSTLNSQAITNTGQLINDESISSHQQKSQLIMSTKSITKSNSNTSNLSNSNCTLNQSNSIILNHNSNHTSSPMRTIKPANDENVESNEKNLQSTDDNFNKDVRETIKLLIDSIVSTTSISHQPSTNVYTKEEPKPMTVNSATANPSIVDSELNNKKVPDYDLDDLGEDKTKDMVVLRNLEISPPPPPPSFDSDEIATNDEKKTNGENNSSTNTNRRASKRRLTATPEPATSELNQSNESTGRSKRQRTQTKLFQVGEAPTFDGSPAPATNNSTKKSSRASTGGRKKSTTSSSSDANLSSTQDAIIQHSNDLQDVICYEKNDYLAIRNEENTFYLCLLLENVKNKREFIKVRWLDTNNSGKTYFLTTQYDTIPRKSIIMPVNLIRMNSVKKGEQIFTLDDQVRDNVLDRLRRSLMATSETTSSQETISSQETNIE